MSRKRKAPKRIFLTDTKYKSDLILKFMNNKIGIYPRYHSENFKIKLNLDGYLGPKSNLNSFDDAETRPILFNGALLGIANPQAS